MTFQVDTSMIRHHRTAKLDFGPVTHGTVSESSWRDITITDMGGDVSTFTVWTSEGSENERAERLRVVGDPPVEVPLIVPAVEPVSANEYVEGDAC